MNVSLLKFSDESAWQDYINSHSGATIYHSLEWRDILCREYGFEPLYLLAKIRNMIVGAFPLLIIRNFRGNRLSSLPFSIYAGPIGDSTDVVSALLNKSIELAERNRVNFIEVSPCRFSDIECSGFASHEWGEGVAIDLTVGMEALWENIKNKRNVKKGLSMDLKLYMSDGEGIDEFYRLQIRTRRHSGLATPSLAYYQSLFCNMKGKVKLVLVKKEDASIAAGIFFIYKKNVLYALGASDSKFLSCRPNDFMIWSMIQWAQNEGFSELDLGLASFGEKGLLRFKKKWGGISRNVLRYIYPSDFSSSDFSASEISRRTMKKTPEPIHRLYGKYIIKYFG